MSFEQDIIPVRDLIEKDIFKAATAQHLARRREDIAKLYADDRVISIDAEYPIGVADLIMGAFGKRWNDVDVDDEEMEEMFRTFGRQWAQDEVAAGIQGLPVEIENVKFNETDSSNRSHAVAYYTVRLKGPIGALREIANEDAYLTFYDWDGLPESKINEQDDIFKAASPGNIQHREDERQRLEREAEARRERERKAREAERDRLRSESSQKMQKALKLLGMTKIVVDPYNWNSDRLVKGSNKMGEEISLHYSDDGRIGVSGYYPKDRHGTTQDYYGSGYTKLSRPSITLSAGKTPEQIARDVERRFMPVYREHFAAAKKSAEASDSYEDRTLASLQAIKGKRLDDHEKGQKTMSITGPKVGGNDYNIRGTVKASGGGVEMELDNLSPDIARRIMKLIGAVAK